MSQQVKYFLFNSTPILVDYAKYDGAGLKIDETYLKKSDYKEYTLPVASSSILGGVKVGTGLSIDTNGVLSVNYTGTWDEIEGKPFSTLSSDFVVSAANALSIDSSKWATVSSLSTKLDVSTFTTYTDTTAPAKYVAIQDFKKNYLDGNSVAYKADLTALATKAEVTAVEAKIPTKTSDITNDSGFITKDATTLTNFYDKTSIDSLLATLKKNSYQVVDELPAAGEEGIVYLVSLTGSKGYEMWIYEASGWLDLGPTTMDLSGFVSGDNLTSNTIILGNAGSKVKSSGKTIVTTLGTDDTTVPTSKAIVTKLGDYLTTSTAASTYAKASDLTSGLDAKQDKLSDNQLEATNSGITSAKVTAYDEYATTIAGKQDKLSLKAGEAVLKLDGAVLSTLFTVSDVTIG